MNEASATKVAIQGRKMYVVIRFSKLLTLHFFM